MPELLDVVFWVILLWVPLFSVTAYYFGLPLLIRTQQRFLAHPQLLELHLDTLRPALAKFLMTRTNALFDLGFGEPTLVKMPDAVPNVRTYLVMLVNRQTGDKAMVTAIVSTGPDPLQTLYVEFSTSFESGEAFDTLNTAELGAFRPAPLTVRTQVPAVDDPAELYELHRFVMGRHDVRGRKVVYQPGEALDYLVRDVLIKPFDRQVERGWLFYDDDDDCYRTTLKGAYLITWGLLQPFKALRTLAMERRARRILAEFDQARDS